MKQFRFGSPCKSSALTRFGLAATLLALVSTADATIFVSVITTDGGSVRDDGRNSSVADPAPVAQVPPGDIAGEIPVIGRADSRNGTLSGFANGSDGESRSAIASITTGFRATAPVTLPAGNLALNVAAAFRLDGTPDNTDDANRALLQAGASMNYSVNGVPVFGPNFFVRVQGTWGRGGSFSGPFLTSEELPRVGSITTNVFDEFGVDVDMSLPEIRLNAGDRLSFIIALSIQASSTDDGIISQVDTLNTAQLSFANVPAGLELIAPGTLTDLLWAGPPPLPPVSSVLPVSRAVQVGNSAGAFVTIINPAATSANDCEIAPKTMVDGDFLYQTTDPDTNMLTGTPNSPVSIAAGASQTFAIFFTAMSAFPATEIAFEYKCDTGVVTEIPGINTFLLSASDTARPDCIALAASEPPGEVILSSVGVFAVATANVGTEGTIKVTGDTGDATLPVTIMICETDPMTSLCINPTVPTTDSVTTFVAAGATPTFGVFVASDETVTFDPAANRIFLRITDQSDAPIGATSVAVSTVP